MSPSPEQPSPEEVTGPKQTAADRLPGDPDHATLVDQMIRVDQAGEYGAMRIYQGQLAILGHRRVGKTIRRMADQEQHHLDAFNKLIVERKVRPTALTPLWHLAGFALGAGSALLGEKAAMACTVAVEEVIGEHYAQQEAKLGDDEKELKGTIEKFHLEELEHRDTGLAHGAEEAPAYLVLSRAIKDGTRLAIWLSTRI
ncbi:MAG: demethoxyubiquinone hydroxylase family protein [Alphaproteobacteria bacterium]